MAFRRGVARSAELKQTAMNKTTLNTERTVGAGTALAARLAALSLCSPAAYAQERLSFGDALQRVRQHNESLMAGQDEVRQRESEKAAAAGLKVPKVELELRQYLLDSRISIPLDPIPLDYKVQNRQFTQGEVSVTWPVYTGGRIDAANRAAAAKQHEAEAQFRFTGDQLVTELAQRYFGVCLACRARGVAALKVTAMEQHAGRARRLMEEGIISRAETLGAEVALANARTELESADRDVTIAKEGLANTMAWDGAAEPATPLFLMRGLEAKEHFLDSVAESHPVLAMLGAKREQARQGVRAEEGANRPTVYVFGRHELITEDLTLLDPKWAMGIGGQYTLFDGAQGKNKVAAAKAQEERVAHLRQKYQRDLRSLTVKRYEEMEKAREQYDSLDTTLALTTENLRVRTRAFEEGVATSLEVVDAALTHARAQLGRLKAAYDFDTAFFQLLESSGQTGRHAEYLAKAIPVPENESFPGPADPSLVEPLNKKPAESKSK